MAAELCEEKWVWSESLSAAITSPRLSFSIDFPPSSTEARSPSASASYDFDFCVSEGSSDLDSRSAAELFSNGKLLPLPIQTKNNNTHVPILPPPSPRPSAGSLREENKKGSAGVKPQVPPGRSFWLFPRSISLNSGSGSKPSFNFSRSKSAGFNPIPSPKQRPTGHVAAGGGAAKSLLRRTASNGGVKSASSYYYGGARNGSYYCGHGVRISPILNVPAPYFLRRNGSAGFFDLRHLLCNGKGKSKKKQLFSHGI